MAPSSTRSLRSAATSFLALAGTASAHSWIEYAYKIAPNGTFVGPMGYPRGFIPRTSTNPLWSDFIPQWLIPYIGNSSYGGDEIINKYTYEADPEYPMLEAAAGDHIAMMHYENGHVTLPQINPNKPANRGTIYLYGTSQPKEHEKLFDVHLVWNRNGTGGDGRGKLLATRNYDDGVCFQSNTGPISEARAAKYASEGANHDTELVCQSDVQLPDDLEAGSVYTIYWYWDWPTLNPDLIDVNKTTDGLYPWAGTFMRGESYPQGWNMSTIAQNESYSSTIDIKITKASSSKDAALSSSKFTGSEWIVDQDIYSKAREDQMSNNFQVNAHADTPASGNGKGPNGKGPSHFHHHSGGAPSGAAPTASGPFVPTFPGPSGVGTTSTPPPFVPTFSAPNGVPSSIAGSSPHVSSGGFRNGTVPTLATIASSAQTPSAASPSSSPSYPGGVFLPSTGITTPSTTPTLSPSTTAPTFASPLIPTLSVPETTPIPSTSPTQTTPVSSATPTPSAESQPTGAIITSGRPQVTPFMS